MEKYERDFKINYPLDWTYRVSIKKLKKDIKEIEKLGATHVNIEHGIDYDCPYIEIDAICRRIETDEEFEQRKKEVEARWEKYRQQELKQLAELKAKYDNLSDYEFQEKRKYYYLAKKDIMPIYFKCKGKTGHTFTSHLPDAMRFNSRNEAMEYNKKWLYGGCEVVEY